MITLTYIRGERYHVVEVDLVEADKQVINGESQFYRVTGYRFVTPDSPVPVATIRLQGEHPDALVAAVDSNGIPLGLTSWGFSNNDNGGRDGQERKD